MTVTMPMFRVRFTRVIIVGMVAINDMRRHVLVKKSGNDLDANEACNEAAHHQEARLPLVPVILGEIALGRGEHAIQRRKYLSNTL